MSASTRVRPNILWICTDQQRWDTIQALGNTHIHTPNIDRLVAQGVAFSHAYCQSPICTPSRSSFLTGMYPSSIRACGNGNEQWAEAAPLVTKLLKDAGYDCGLAGKLHLAGAAGRVEPRPQDDGYRVFHWSHDPQDRYPANHAYADWLRAQGYDLAELNKDMTQLPPYLHQTTWCTDRAIDFLEEERASPWLMSINVFDPHAPFDPPQPYMDKTLARNLPEPLFQESDLAAQQKLAGIDFQEATDPRTPAMQQTIAAYYAMIELIDDNVGRLLDALERTGQREETVVIFMSDHGEMLGDHGLLLKGCRFYEGLVRVPLIFSWPGVISPGVVSDALVELTDVAPTLLEMAGEPAPARMQGRSLAPLLTGGADTTHHRDFVRCEYYRALNPDAPGRMWQGSYATMLRNEKYKLVAYHGHEHGELFDLVNDPHEFTNLWDDPAFAAIRFDLLKQSFDALVFAVDTGTPQRHAF